MKLVVFGVVLAALYVANIAWCYSTGNPALAVISVVGLVVVAGCLGALMGFGARRR